jgi:hypothetical protein
MKIEFKRCRFDKWHCQVWTGLLTKGICLTLWEATATVARSGPK